MTGHAGFQPASSSRLRDQACGGNAHIDEERALALAERGEVEMLEARLVAAGFVARDEGHAVGDVAMGERDLQGRGGGEPGGDAGNDLDLDAGLAQARRAPRRRGRTPEDRRL